MDKPSDMLRQNAENCLELSEKAASEPSSRRYQRMAEAWNALADEQDWLDGEVPPIAAPDLKGAAIPAAPKPDVS
ncbi:hypothetical protein [Bradyrhizobium sp. LHD-71]|uniref:hypothetical protein n=1 Tax=Bradyrhizobium sp. LHD-71 TaxID=3072141 RepID=UPI00280EB174|nr:hypothetical protein [Bradyrhizobium sp. LHD-71]MDQ8731591.1 hypothetical protein [Bradyrhizobium sp. LHD-71]